MANSAFINPTPEQKLMRNMGRIKTLQLAIEQCKDESRKQSLQAELDRRMNELEAHKEDILKMAELLSE